jgi:hypothetical protein
MDMSDKKKEAEVKVTEPEFTKDQVVSSAKYSDKKDVITALWTDGSKKTLSKVDAMIKDFMEKEFVKGSVK